MSSVDEVEKKVRRAVSNIRKSKDVADSWKHFESIIEIVSPGFIRNSAVVVKRKNDDEGFIESSKPVFIITAKLGMADIVEMFAFIKEKIEPNEFGLGDDTHVILDDYNGNYIAKRKKSWVLLHHEEGYEKALKTWKSFSSLFQELLITTLEHSYQQWLKDNKPSFYKKIKNRLGIEHIHPSIRWWKKKQLTT